MDALEAAVVSTDQKFGYSGTVGAHPPVPIDYVPPFGEGKGYTPLELLLMSLGACSSGTIGFLLRKMGKSVAAVRATAKGIRREEHPTSFKKIHLEFTVTSGDARDADVEKALALAEGSVCPVWAMVKGNAEITAAFRLVRA